MTEDRGFEALVAHERSKLDKSEAYWERRTAEDDALELLAEWYDWWIETPGAPEKMPNALHVRTALLLTRPDLPRDEDGHIITSASFGEAAIVQIQYRTDENGKCVEADDGSLVEGVDDYPCTYHGAFESMEEAQAWMDAYPDGDTDIVEMQAIYLNRVRP